MTTNTNNLPAVSKSTPAQRIAARMLAEGMAWHAAEHARRKEANRKSREEAQANPALCATLLAEAQRRGQSAIDWVEYFRNIDVNYP